MVECQQMLLFFFSPPGFYFCKRCKTTWLLFLYSRCHGDVVCCGIFWVKCKCLSLITVRLVGEKPGIKDCFVKRWILEESFIQITIKSCSYRCSCTKDNSDATFTIQWVDACGVCVHIFSFLFNYYYDTGKIKAECGLIFMKSINVLICWYNEC